ncbi:DNA helicase ZGRF1-like domain-containing protein [Aspergillus luchuensis]|uniref:Uncharacterized protein n=1 Tax=Aspergillus kawachii TaxID=1069201 RepID=A0A7R7WFR7_ASPKA|nr:uncharacterized protein AKAW2_60425S [Aspergillus luchuensis]BCS02161.1 hypothetical protein AKAW2_60425S [Aspergillus luchuensis]BCS13847.1 hypothetical protein ALUC_60403S [Aspergillus luchuensis]GAA90523.1 similar to An15g02750 [Aspergillus luchuensis IFO 4308]
MATPRSTPSMNVPATQNTAPVIRFRCLYTYDMRRKAKRWQDGFLRYHTFNKRIMVYDVAGNFVGDHHCRQDEGIQDGDELELDNGALIEVCEPVERTETDLSGLHSNKRKGQGSPSQRPGGTPTPTTVVYNSSTPARPTLPSQQKPTRSLNDLLGIKKTPTPTQRAGLPQTGPTSNHTLPVNGNENERADYPAKRKKTETASEKVTRRREPASIDLTGTEPEPETSKRQTETTSVAHSRTTDPKKHTTAPPISHLKPTHQANNIPQRKQTAPNPPRPREQPQPEPEPEPPRNNDPPANILRLPSKTKPSRKKLMYHTILAQQQQQQQQPQSENDHDNDPIVLSDDDDNDNNPPPSPPPRPQHTTTTTIPTTTTPKPPLLLKAGTERRTSSSSLQKAHSDPTAFTRFNLTTNTTTNNARPPPQQHHNHRRRASESGNSPLDTTDNENTNEEDPESDGGGPWTWEAQYLFDYWPAGRAKPTRTC